MLWKNNIYKRYQDQWKSHKDALLKLGYRQRHTYKIQYLKQGSVQEKQLWAEFHKRYPKGSYSVGWGSDLSIEDLTERMPVWDKLIEQYDVPAGDPCQPVAPEHTAVLTTSQ